MPSSSVTPLSNQEWCDVLISDIKSKTPNAKSAQAQKNARRLLGSALEELDIQINDAPCLTTGPSLPDSEAQKILWKLTELNFRFELLGLDKRANPSNRDEDARQDLIQECFGTNSLLIVNHQLANVRLGSGDWRKRLPCLLMLRRLMRDWEGMKPTPLLLLDLTSISDYVEADALQLEEAVAMFYTDSSIFLVVLLSYPPIFPNCLAPVFQVIIMSFLTQYGQHYFRHILHILSDM